MVSWNKWYSLVVYFCNTFLLSSIWEIKSIFNWRLFMVSLNKKIWSHFFFRIADLINFSLNEPDRNLTLQGVSKLKVSNQLTGMRISVKTNNFCIETSDDYWLLLPIAVSECSIYAKEINSNEFLEDQYFQNWH